MIAKQVRKMGWDIILYGPDALTAPKFFELAGDMDKIYLSSLMSLDVTQPVAKVLVTEFEKKHAGLPPLSAIYGYDAVKVAAKVIENGGIDRASLRDSAGDDRLVNLGIGPSIGGGLRFLFGEYLYFGLHGKAQLVPWMWTALAFNVSAFVIFLIPRLRENLLLLNIGAILIFVGVYIEKGLGLIVPGFIPDALGEIYEYWPSATEGMIAAGIWALGALLYTIMIKFSVPIYTGELLKKPARG